MESKFLKLNRKDVINGLIMAIITPAILAIYKTVEAGSFNFDWKSLGAVAFAGGLGYIVKTFFSGNTTETVLFSKREDLIGTRPKDREGKRG